MKAPSPLRNPNLRMLIKGAMYSIGDVSNDSGLGFSLDCEPVHQSSTVSEHSKVVLDENACDAHFSIVENFRKTSDEEPPFKIPRTDYTEDRSLDPMLAVAGRQLYEELTKDAKIAPSEQAKSHDLAQLQGLLREVIRSVSQRHDDVQNSFVVTEAVSTPNRAKSTSQRAAAVRSNGVQQGSRPPPQVPNKGGARRLSNSKRHLLPVSQQGRNKINQMELRILSQPEEQHRARYLTEGSRGAVKDRKGTGFPTVKLFGYSRPVTLQVFIGTDQGKVQPHLFYQTSKVCGKNSTPCTQRKIEGTVVLEIDMLPDKDMTVSCDCVGILKERNVDVEQRLLQFGGTYNKKRSTKCRLVFRASVPQRDGSIETLQVVSAPILCTQPPGIPEICRKSLSECSARGNTEMFLIGKNFLKDTKVIFYDIEDDLQGDSEDGLTNGWKKVVTPEKEYLQQTHLICTVPPYHDELIGTAVRIRMVVESSGKRSEAHTFIYTPATATHSLSHSMSVVVPSPESSLSSSLAISTHSPIPSPQDLPRLGASDEMLPTLDPFMDAYPVSDVMADLTPIASSASSTQMVPETPVSWKADQPQDIVDIWMKPESSQELPLFPTSSPPSGDQCLRDLLTQQPDKLVMQTTADLCISPSDGNCQPEPSTGFGRSEMMEMTCSSPVDALASVSADPMLMMAYPNSILNQSATETLTSAEIPPMTKAETTTAAAAASQGSIEQISTMMTMLRDSELLQLINTSTFDKFDNV